MSDKLSKLDKILKQRGNTHGDYGLMAEISQSIKESVLRHNKHGMSPYMIESVEMIAHKLARIAAGNPFVEDHWRDIAGYATLSADKVALRDTNMTAGSGDHVCDAFSYATCQSET